MKRFYFLLPICLITLFNLASCYAPVLLDKYGQNLMTAPKIYTLVNLHPDGRSQLYAINYQQRRGIIPLCSEVLFEDISRNLLVFRVVETGRTYNYRYHKAAREPFYKHLVRHFGSACDQERIENMSDIDKQGIHSGNPLVGMSREGIVLALGYPPRHKNHWDSPKWVYWRNRFNRVTITFNSDWIVTQVVE